MQGYSPAGFDKWRCKCGFEHDHVHLYCFACGKRRWEQLAIGYLAALDLVQALYSVDAERVA